MQARLVGSRIVGGGFCNPAVLGPLETTVMRRIVTAACPVLLFIQALVLPAPVSAGTDQEAKKARVEAAKKVYDLHVRRLFNVMGDFPEVFLWERRLTEAELELAQDKDERLAALKAHLKRIQK